MKKLFTLVVLLTCFLGAKAIEIVDVEVDFSKYTDIKDFKWYGWGASESAQARLSIVDGCLHFESTEVTDPDWDCQFHPIGGVQAEEGQTYTLHFKVKGDHAENISALGFGITPYGQFPITTEWVEGTFDYVAASTGEANLLFQCGGYVGTWDIAYLKITHEGREETPVDWKDIITNGDASADWENPNAAVKKIGDDYAWAEGQEEDQKICAWSKEFNNKDPEDNTKDLIHPATIQGGAFVVKTDIVNPVLVWAEDGELWGKQHSAGDPKDDNEWQNQFWINLPRPLKDGEPFKVSFKYKASEEAKAQVQAHKAPGAYLGKSPTESEYNFTTEWKTYASNELTAPAGMQSIAFNLGVNQQYLREITFYFDDIKVELMQLKDGFFVAGVDTENGGNLLNYDFSKAIELVEDAEMSAATETTILSATLGEAENESTWVNQVMISTQYGRDKGFKANALTVKDKITNDKTNFLSYSAAGSARLNLPVRGQWKIYVAPDAEMISFEKLAGEPDKVAIEINPNPTEIVLNAVERDYLAEGETEAGTGNVYDSQIYIKTNRALKAGEKTVLAFDYKASQEAAVSTQLQNANFGYMMWDVVKVPAFTTEWKPFSLEFTVPADADKMQVLAFNMSVIKAACTYEIKNVVWKLDDDTESLIYQEGAENFFLKEGAGWESHKAGTDAVPPTDGISTVVSKKNAGSAVIYNLAGQRVSNSFKGIVVKDGKKYVK